MAEKKSDKKEIPDLKDAVSKIWMAGVGALKKAEEEGSKIFKSLVEKGQEFQETSKDVSQKQVDKISGILKGSVDSVKGTIDDIASKEGIFEKLGFEDIMDSVLKKFGVVTKKEFERLTKKINDLNKTISELRKSAQNAKKGK